MSDLNSAISTPMDVTDYKSISSVKVSRVSVQPENKTELALTGGNTSDLYFSIPSRPSSFLNGQNSYLTFTYTAQGTTHDFAKHVSISNGTGGSFIKTLETIAGSTSLELINNYNVLNCVQDDFMSATRSKTLGSILEDKHHQHIKRGEPRDISDEDADGFFDKRRICIPLMSVAVGTLQDKYFPVDKDVGLRLRLTMEDPNIVFQTDGEVVGTSGYKLEDITFELEYLECGPATYQQIVQESGGVMKVSGTGVGNFATSLPAGSKSNTILIPARFSSVRNYLTCFRSAMSATSRRHNSTGGRTRDYIQNYVYRVHGKNYPNLPVSADEYTSAEVMCEVLKAFHSLHNTISDCVFTKSNFCQSSSVTEGAFLTGIDFEEPGFSAGQMSGLDTQSANTFLTLEHSRACSALVVDTFAFYDTIIEINTVTGEVMVSK